MSVSERTRASDRRLALLGAEPGAYAIARHTRISPMKARRVVNLVRGAAVQDALDTLQFAPQAAAETVRKVLVSAIANAETTEGLAAGDLVISQARVDEGPTMKRWRPRAKGRATRINKRTSHITLVVQPQEVVAAHKSARKAAQKGAQKSAQTSATKRAVKPPTQQVGATDSEKGRTA